MLLDNIILIWEKTGLFSQLAPILMTHSLNQKSVNLTLPP